jgi:ABC-2 type transport system ATP-binding protein
VDSRTDAVRRHPYRPALMAAAAIEVSELRKSYGDVKALCGVDLAAPAGSVLGLLGPNGAGKTTAVRILTTLLPPDGGSARVAGLDVVRDAAKLRAQIGLAGQYAAVDENLTGRENLEMVGRLYHLGRRPSLERANELLERFALTDAAKRLVRTYSGGMRRRLDLAAALVARPPVLFLDEPTTGLDPRSRLQLWETIEDRVAAGTTVLLTTQYLDEADRLADSIAVIDHGRVIAEGTSDELKDRVGGERLQVTLHDAGQSITAIDALAPIASGDPPTCEKDLLSLPMLRDSGGIAEAVRRLDGAGVGIDDIAVHRPTLDDVFIALTGRAAEQQNGAGDEQEPRREDEEQEEKAA